ncbi:hypothetical protein [Bacillus toyonensis]|uniref:hypothetical protein n=1 Tax=Bacillus toyonensis TaxID=155322 RepID=UPI000BF8C6A3|nr:hypothetical protein [Bacillus toyonensis]PGF05192.1 hypothetical protein COM61_01865 [Bacillus toyonensis]
MKKTKSFTGTIRGMKTGLDVEINNFLTTHGYELLDVQYTIYHDVNGNPVRDALITYEDKKVQETVTNKNLDLVPKFITNGGIEITSRMHETMVEEIQIIKGLAENGEKGVLRLWEKYGQNLIFSHEEMTLMLERRFKQLQELEKEE